MATKNPMFKHESVIRNQPKMERLCDLLHEYCNLINPFGITKAKLSSSVIVDNVRMEFVRDGDELCYKTVIIIDNHYLKMGFYHDNGTLGIPEVDDVVYVIYQKDESYWSQGDDDLRNSLKTGCSWTDEIPTAMPATDEQIEFMLHYLEISLKEMKEALSCV